MSAARRVVLSKMRTARTGECVLCRLLSDVAAWIEILGDGLQGASEALNTIHQRKCVLGRTRALIGVAPGHCRR